MTKLRTHTSTLLLTVGLGLLSAACHRDKTLGSQPDGPIGLTVVDSVRLAENDTVSVGRPAGFAVTANAIIASDNDDQHVIEYTRHGGFVRQFGRRGKGPGELESVGSVAIIGDSLIAVKNLAAANVSIFDRSTGQYRWKAAIPSRIYDLVADDNRLSGAAITADGKGSVSVFSDSSGDVYTDGVVPDIYKHFPVLVGPFGTVMHDRRGVQLVEAFEGTNFIFFRRAANAPFDSIELPVLRRKGAKAKLLERVAVDTSHGKEALFASSIPMTLGFLNDSIVAVVHSDVELDRNLFTGSSYISLLDLRRYRVCVDLPLPLPADPLPRTVLVGDTLFALVQHVEGQKYSGTYVVRLAIDLDACPWNYVQKR